MNNFMLDAHDKKVINTLLIGIILPLLDMTIINIAIHKFGDTFNSSISYVQWIITCYVLSTACVIPICSWGVKKYGDKNIWLLGLFFFMIGSFFCALASNLEFLIFSRILQGIGSGMLLPVMQTIITNNIHPDKVKLAFAAISVPAVIVPIIGPIIGGLIMAYLGWRWLFLINMPLTCYAINIAYQNLNTGPKLHSIRFDIIGFLLLSPALLFLIYGLTHFEYQSHAANFAHIAIGLGVTLLCIFTIHAKNITYDPILDIKLFNHKNFRSASLTLLLASVAFYGGLFVFPLYLSQVQHYDSMLIGFLLASQGIGALISRKYLTFITRHLGDKNAIIVFILLSCIGTFYFVLPAYLFNMYLSILFMFMRGAGLGLVTILAMSSAYNGLEKSQLPDASVISRILTQAGAALGTAGLAVILNTLISKNTENLTLPYSSSFEWLLILTLLCIIPACGIKDDK